MKIKKIGMKLQPKKQTSDEDHKKFRKKNNND